MIDDSTKSPSSSKGSGETGGIKAGDERRDYYGTNVFGKVEGRLLSTVEFVLERIGGGFFRRDKHDRKRDLCEFASIDDGDVDEEVDEGDEGQRREDELEVSGERDGHFEEGVFVDEKRCV